MCRRRRGEHRDKGWLGFLACLPMKMAECSQIPGWTLKCFLLLRSFLLFFLSVCLLQVCVNTLKCGAFEKLMVIFRLKETILVYSKEHHSV